MSDFVTLRHPKLPANQTIRVHRKRIGARLAAGWVEVGPDTDPEPKPEPEPVEPEPVPAAEPEKPKRQRRTNSEEQ